MHTFHMLAIHRTRECGRYVPVHIATPLLHSSHESSIWKWFQPICPVKCVRARSTSHATEKIRPNNKFVCLCECVYSFFFVACATIRASIVAKRFKMVNSTFHETGKNTQNEMCSPCSRSRKKVDAVCECVCVCYNIFYIFVSEAKRNTHFE